MKKLKITEARKKLFELADQVTASGEELVLSRRGKKDVVLLDYDQWLCVREAAARYETSKPMSRSAQGTVVIKTKDLEGDIRRIRQEFASAFEQSIENF